MSPRDVVIVGAGPSGLAVAACLVRQGLRPLILERGATIGTSWRRHYSSLRLHTTKRQSSLPYRRFPNECPRFPTRNDVVQYIEEYARHFDFEILFDQTVDRIQPHEHHWVVRTGTAEFAAESVVVAIGRHQVPIVPDLEGRDRFRGTVLHSSAYTDGAEWTGRNVLVVGLGNTGADIVVDLCRSGARTTLAVRTPPFIVPMSFLGVHWRTLFGVVPISVLPITRRLRQVESGRVLSASFWRRIQDAVFGDLAAFGLPLASTGHVRDRLVANIPPLVATDFADVLRERRIEIRPAVVSFDERGVRFADGSRADFDAVVLATGFRAATIEGAPEETQAQRGFYLSGYRPELGQIRGTAKQVARMIVRRHAQRNASRELKRSTVRDPLPSK